MKTFFKIQNLKVKAGNKPILLGVNLTIKKGEIHVIMGPNGSGKSTLANAIMGSPALDITSGKITFEGKNITEMAPEERARLGIFMAFQYPKEIRGVAFDQFLYNAYKNIFLVRNPKDKPMSIFRFHKFMEEKMQALKMNSEFAKRSINVGFSGGEKKKAEMLQLAVLEPKIAILDETDSGLDVDALKIVGESVNQYQNKENAVLIVTHYQRILKYLKPDFVHVMIDGKIVKSGGSEFAEELEKKGYENLKRKV